MVWPRGLVLPDGLVTISPYSLESIGAASGSLGSPSSWVWPTADKAIFTPFRISRQILVKNMFLFNGIAVNGNFDIGIYDRTGVRLVSSGSVVQAGVSSLQAVDVADTLIGPGLFYMALVFDNVVATIYASRPGFAQCRAMGLATMLNAFILPATAVFATIADHYVNLHGLTARVVV